MSAGSGYSLRYDDWLQGWREWARTRKRGKMAQFIVEKLEEGNQAQWLNIEGGLFELTEWHAIAKEWFGEKPRNSEEVDAPCMLRKGLPRAFPGLDEIKEKSRKEGTQYRSRVFKAPQSLMNDVLLHITNNAGPYLQNGGDMIHNYPPYSNNPVFNVSSTSNNSVVSTVPTYFGGNNHPQMVGGIYTNPTTTGHVEMDIQHPSSDYHQLVGTNHNGSQNYMPPQGQYTSDDINIYVDRITENGIDGNSSNGNYHSTATSNGLYNNYSTPPSSVSMLGVPSPVGFQPKEEMGSPPSGPPPYSTSPASTHSPRISPEPSLMGSTGSYPPSVQQPNVITGSEMSPSTLNSSSPAVQMEPELMKVKANPNSSPLEGGGQMVLLFYNPLPLGKKVVVFCSQKSRDLMYAQEAIQENMMALICQIPEYPYPEEVQLQVYNYNQIIARTTFIFYQQTLPMHPPSDMILQILSSQLQSHFPSGNGGMGHGNGGRSDGGDQMSGSGGYHSNYIPNSMYHLLLGACRLGCEPLVHCLLSSPVMEDLTLDQMKEAYECAVSNGHETLSEVLMELTVLHDMTPTVAPSSGFISRGLGGNSQPDQVQHVPAYYDVLDELHQGGDSPQARAETVLKQLLIAMKDYKEKIDQKEEVKPKEEHVVGTLPEPEDVTTPIIEITPNLTVDQLSVEISKTSLSPKRRLSSSNNKLTRQSNSISDEDDELHHSDIMLKSPAVFHSRESWAEVNDIVPDLVSHKKKHPYTQQSDADSAIGMSFEEELNSLVNSEMQSRRSSLLIAPDMFSQHNDSITIKLSADVGLGVANGLEWEGSIVVTEDYPSGQDRKILCKGDRIVQVGEKLIRGMSAVDFSELFQVAASEGTIIRIIPAANQQQLQPSETSPMPQQRSLKRTSSEQFSDSIKTKINQLISTRPSVDERHVTISRTASGYPIKIIGGKTVGVFVSDVRSDYTQLYPGDEILELNGHSTRGLTLYDANQIVQTTSGDLKLSVIENKTKFLHVREQIEIDSMYLRSLVDYKPTNNREMTLRKGSLLRVVNTCSLPNNWLAWTIDENTGTEAQLKKILPPTIAKLQFGSDAYERVERSNIIFRRPLCVTGPNSDMVAKIISDEQQYSLCDSFEQILGVCSKGTNRAVMSINDPNNLELLKALQPIIVQTPLDSAPLVEQSKFAKVSPNSFLTGENSSDLAQQAITQMHRLQDLPVWKPVGVI